MRLLRCPSFDRLRMIRSGTPRNDVLHQFVIYVSLILLLCVFMVMLPINVVAQTTSPTPSPAYAIIINQIRGESCCSPGNLENTRTQLDNAVRYELPTTFVLRYDALTDPRYAELILSYQRLHPALIQTGVMVEIVPDLIADTNARQCERDSSSISSLGMTEESGSPIESGMTRQGDSGLEGQRTISAAQMSEESVLRQAQDDTVPDEFLREEIGCCPENTTEISKEGDSSSTNSLGMTEQKDNADTTICDIPYKGTEETWFQAQNAFTIGYPIESRKQIIDTLLAQYQNIFGTYPKVSSAWMIDTDSVNHLHDRYGVVTHQITREQWGTDSYTLYGGPPHYPFPASRNWIMMPDYEQAQAVTIVRQTVTDPLYNYGDTSSLYTSQPNDYMRGGRGIEYFKTLIDNAIHQQSVGFGNIGLENSMDAEYQTEYAGQLAYIAKLRDEDKLLVVFPDAVGPIFQNDTITTYTRTEGRRQAVWITSPQYRARIIRNGTEVSLTDFRVYSPDLKDPYATRVAKHEGYWVVPFLLDGSRWYERKNITVLPHAFVPIQNDFFTNPTRLEFTKQVVDAPLRMVHSAEGVILNDSNGSHLTTFRVAGFSIPFPIKPASFTPQDFPIQVNEEGMKWMTEGKESWSLNKLIEACGASCKDKTTLQVNIQPKTFSRALDVLYPYLLPESVGRDLSHEYTRVSVNNTFAVAGRNPVRLVLEPHDAMNFPIILDAEAEITVDPDDTAVTRLGKLVSSQQQYVDLDRSDAQKVSVTVKMNQRGKSFLVTKTVYFAPNCKNDWGYCVVHPIQGTWYILTKLTDWWSGRK